MIEIDASQRLRQKITVLEDGENEDESLKEWESRDGVEPSVL